MGFRARLEKTWHAIEGAMYQTRRRTHEHGTAEDRSLSALPPLLNQAHRNLELLGRATGEPSNDGAGGERHLGTRSVRTQNSGRPDRPSDRARGGTRCAPGLIARGERDRTAGAGCGH
jgi:hypothetical protein